MNSIKTPLEMFYRWEKECPEQVFLRQSLGNQQWREYTWGQFADRVRRLANFIVRMQLPAASNIAIWSSNSADWVVADLAIMLSGHVSVPLYAGQDADSARYILRQSDCRLAFLGEFDGAAQFTDIRPQQIITVAMHGNTIERDFDIEQIIAAVAPFLPSPVPDPEALMTIVYSRGAHRPSTMASPSALVLISSTRSRPR